MLPNIWFTSDTHWFHTNILKLCDRPFTTIEEHNEQLIQNHNSVVHTNDWVFNLGDIIMGNKQENIPKILPRLNGTLTMCRGNHDSNWRRPDKDYLYMDHGVKACHNSIQLDLSDYGLSSALTLSHLPPKVPGMVLSRYDEKFYKHCLQDNNTIFLYGHTHSKEKVSAHRAINVGVDAWNYYPVSLDNIIQLITSW